MVTSLQWREKDEIDVAAELVIVYQVMMVVVMEEEGVEKVEMAIQEEVDPLREVMEERDL